MSKKLLVTAALVMSSTVALAADLPKGLDQTSMCVFKTEVYSIGAKVQVGKDVLVCTRASTNTAPAYWK